MTLARPRGGESIATTFSLAGESLPQLTPDPLSSPGGAEFVWGISPQLLDEAGVHPWSTDPNQSRELLMGLSSFELHRGVQVESVLKDQGRIVGARTRDIAGGRERDWLANITVGDDGAHSLVRAACGIELATRVFPRDLLCFLCDWPMSLQPDAGHIWPNRSRSQPGILAAGILPAPHARGVGVAPIRPELASDDPRTSAAWQALIDSEPTLASVVGDLSFPRDFQRVRRPWGHAPCYGAPGALVMGDAAHPVSPAGGQGANMSIADGRAIAELALAGERDLLAKYERIRRPANRRSLRFTRGAAFVLGLPEWLLPPPRLFWLVGKVGSRPGLLARFVRAASTAFVARM
jgi:2-polyprenyl-6-methoxyphenol hydroxylase-like FAD-dependent oxidoreductase